MTISIMRKLICFMMLFLGAQLFTFAQNDPKAKAILDEVSKKYRTFNTVKVTFSYTIDNPQAKIKDTQTGTLLVRSKTNKFKVSLKGQEVISDGKTQWTYLVADKEVQITQVDTNPDALNPAKIFTLYEKGFKYLYVGDSKINRKTCHIVDLIPLDDKRSFFKVRLQIDKVSKQISNALIFDRNGSRYTYTIKSFDTSIQEPESSFSFDPKKYPGVEVVDLR